MMTKPLLAILLLLPLSVSAGEHVDVFNEGRLKLDKTLATVHSGYWNCAPPADKKKIRAALTHKFGTPDRVEDIGVLWSIGDANVYTLGKRHISVSLYSNSTNERIEALRRERELSDI